MPDLSRDVLEGLVKKSIQCTHKGAVAVVSMEQTFVWEIHPSQHLAVTVKGIAVYRVRWSLMDDLTN